MALAGAAVNDSSVRNLQDMLLTYNKITEACFNKCVSNMNYRDLTDREATCVNRCASKFINGSHRIMSTFMEIQGRKQREMMQEAAKRNEELALSAAQAAAPSSETAAPSSDIAEAMSSSNTDDATSSSSTQSDSVTENTEKL